MRLKAYIQRESLLFFLTYLFNQLPKIEGCGEEEYEDLIKKSLIAVKEKVEGITFSEEDILNLAKKYRDAFKEWHCFSSKERFEETKKALEKMHIHPVCTNYYDETAMGTLAKIISDEDLSIAFFNVTNVLEYYNRFFELERYPCPIKGVDNTLYLKKLPLTEDTLCAYSSLMYRDDRQAATCNGDVFFEEAYQLHKLNIYYDVCGETLNEEKADKDLVVDACLKLAQIDPREAGKGNVLTKLRNLLAHSSQEALFQLSKNYRKIKKTIDKNKAYQFSLGNEHKKLTFLAVLQLALGEAGLKVNRPDSSYEGRRKKRQDRRVLTAETVSDINACH